MKRYGWNRDRGRITKDYSGFWNKWGSGHLSIIRFSLRPYMWRGIYRKFIYSHQIQRWLQSLMVSLEKAVPGSVVLRKRGILFSHVSLYMSTVADIRDAYPSVWLVSSSCGLWWKLLIAGRTWQGLISTYIFQPSLWSSVINDSYVIRNVS